MSKPSTPHAVKVDGVGVGSVQRKIADGGKKMVGKNYEVISAIHLLPPHLFVNLAARENLPVMGGNGHLHDQKMRVIAPDIAFKITDFPSRLDAFEVHSRRLLKHTSLKAIQWANITHERVDFATIR